MHRILPVIKMLLIEQWKQHNEKSTTLSKRLMKGGKTLTIAQRAQALDEAYKAEKIAIDKAAADAVGLGSKSDTAAITTITSPTNLEKYKNKTMGDFKDTYEQTILNYLGTREADWNEAEGKFVMKRSD